MSHELSAVYYCGVLDFDETFFPSGYMTRFFDRERVRFTAPKPVRESLLKLDLTMKRFFERFMHLCRFRIITHASAEWVRQALEFFPNVERYVSWNYIQLIPCENFTKYAKLYAIMSREKPFARYFCCGDSIHDVEAVPEVVHKLGLRAFTRSLRFVSHPSIETLQFEWEKLSGIFQQLMMDNDVASSVSHLSHHFVVSGDCKSGDTYACPGWYGACSSANSNINLEREVVKPSSPLPPILEVPSTLSNVKCGIKTKS